jgi:antitoxin (DNA-binding transcriptional repressor) of toxin-antitoxin stability system
MTTVALQDLQAEIGRCLALVRGGQTVRVMDHDEVVAEIRRPEPQPEDHSSWAQFVERGVREGWLTPATRSNIDDVLQELSSHPKAPEGVNWQSLLDRDDRF